MTKLMAILNVTPDSFYAESRAPTIKAAIVRGIAACDAGADILDIGGESTRPGSDAVSVEEELQRVIPVIEALRIERPNVPISIDTMKPEVAARAVEAGAALINDVSGFRDPAMREVAAESDAEVCVMHMLGMPKTMQKNPHYPEGMIPALIKYFEQQIELLTRAGVAENRIILDPGIGFGKSVEHNLEILQNLPQLRLVGFPVLLGVSRKSFMTKILNKPATELLFATVALNTLAVRAGIEIIRVHDVEAHRDVIDLVSVNMN